MSARSRRGAFRGACRAAERLARSVSIGVIGAGRVGAVLGAALCQAGHRVVARLRRLERHTHRIARAAARRRRYCRPIRCRASPTWCSSRCRTTPWPAWCAGLAEAGALRPGQVVAHTSGAHGLAVLAPAVAAGARPLALHPAMTFTGHAGRPGPARRDLLRRDRARTTCARSPPGWSPTWAARRSGSPRRTAPLYHAALAHGANHLVTLVNEAMDRLRDAGVAQPERVLGPLLRAALENALRHGDAALTGPVAARRRRHRGAAPGDRCGRPRRTRWPLPGAGPPDRRPGDRRPAGCARPTPSRCWACWPSPPGTASEGPRREAGATVASAAARTAVTAIDRGARADAGRAGRARAAMAGRVAVVMTMGALHAGHAAPAAGGPRAAPTT